MERPPIDWSDGDGRWLLERTLLSAGVGKKYLDATWEKVRTKAIWDYAAKIDEHRIRGAGLIVTGPVGTGKTSAAALIAAEAVKHELTVKFRYVPTMLERLSDRGSREWETRQQVNPDVLIWDDLGVGGVMAWQMGLLDRIVEIRYGKTKPMIVTTNLSVGMLTDIDGMQRIVDRWRERGFMVRLGGESMRRDDGA